MGLKNRLEHEKESLLNEISDAARRGATSDVLTASEKLSKVKTLLDRYNRLQGDIDDMFVPKSKPKEGSIHSNDTNANGPDIAGRGIGKTIRQNFLKKASEEGIHLSNVRGSIYETPSGHRVGIAVATERRPDRWFLGLPSKRFEHAVLLCKPESGNTIEICIPKNILGEYKMSESGDQTKFNITRRGNNYLMLVPGTDGVNISRFVGDFSQLHE